MPTRGVNEGRQQQQSMRQFIDLFLGLTQGLSDDARNQISRVLGHEGVGQFQGLLDRLRGFHGQMPELFGSLNQTNFPAEMREVMSRLPGGMDAAAGLFANGGRTDDTADAMHQFRTLMNFGVGPARQAAEGAVEHNGFTTPMALLRQMAVEQFANNNGFTGELEGARDFGLNLLATGGQTPDTRGLFERGNAMFQAGGRDAGTQALSQAGQNLMFSGGMTPDMQGFMRQIMPLIMQGGMTPEARQLFGEMMGVLQGRGGVVRPDEEVFSQVRDQVATASRQASEAARRTAMQRQGAASVSGNSNLVMNEFEDRAMQAEAQALREAAKTQQDARLQQFGVAAGTAGDVSKSAQNLVGVLSGAGADVFRSASANVNTGAGLMEGSERIALGRAGLGQQAAQQALMTELERMGLGSNIFNNANAQALGRSSLGLQTASNMDALAAQRWQQALQTLLGDAGIRLGAGDSAMRLAGLETGRVTAGLSGLAGLGGLGIQGSLGQQGMDLGRLTAQLSNTLASLGLDQQTINSLVNGGINGGQALGGLAGLFGGLTNTGLNNFGGISQQLIQAAMQPGFWERLAGQAVSGAVGGLTGGIGMSLGGIFNPNGNQGGWANAGRVNGLPPQFSIPGMPGGFNAG